MSRIPPYLFVAHVEENYKVTNVLKFHILKR